MAKAFVLGGNGLIGRGLVPHLVEHGWRVTVGSRSGVLPSSLRMLGIDSIRLDRSVPGALAAAADGADVLIDLIAFSGADAQQINALAGCIGSAVVISSASVYVDDRGRSLDEATSLDTFPKFPVPIPEDQPVVTSSNASYSGRKVAMEQALLAGPLDVTVVRPGAIHGPGASLPREVFFVKRFVDRRNSVVLVDGGQSRFHTTSVANLAEMVRLAAENPAKRVLNCGDPEALTTSEIGHAIAEVLGRPALREVLLPESRYERPAFPHPWAVPAPIVLDMRAAEAQLGYRAVTTYPEAVRATCEWLLAELRSRDWSDTYLGRCFDYAAEDAIESGASPGRGAG